MPIIELRMYVRSCVPVGEYVRNRSQFCKGRIPCPHSIWVVEPGFQPLTLKLNIFSLVTFILVGMLDYSYFMEHAALKLISSVSAVWKDTSTTFFFYLPGGIFI